MANNTSQHILNTAANLLGFCLIVITSLHIANLTETLWIDEGTSVIAVQLIFCCIFSFASIRTSNLKREKVLETAADYLFFSSLIGILIIVMFIMFNYVN